MMMMCFVVIACAASLCVADLPLYPPLWNVSSGRVQDVRTVYFF